jgi:hypothetical protein
MNDGVDIEEAFDSAGDDGSASAVEVEAVGVDNGTGTGNGNGTVVSADEDHEHAIVAAQAIISLHVNDNQCDSTAFTSHGSTSAAGMNDGVDIEEAFDSAGDDGSASAVEAEAVGADNEFNSLLK